MENYRVFYTDMDLPAGADSPTIKLIPLEFATREEAMIDAFKHIHRGGLAWKIEGSDAFRMARDEVEKQYHIFQHT
jgi:hypothetical protein